MPGEVPGPNQLTMNKENILENTWTPEDDPYISKSIPDEINMDSLNKMWPLGYPLPNSSQAKTPIKADNNKLDWSLLPMEALEPVVEVLEFGKTKYSSWNWSEGSGFNWTRVISAALRHIFAWMRGEDLDPETNKSHLAHAVCNLIFLLYYTQNKERYINDDRNKR